MTKILLIDDDEEMCEELSDILKSEHYAVEVCHDGGKGLNLIKSNGYAIALIDLKIPGMCGCDILEYLKKEHPAVKVIVLTGKPLSKKLLQEEEGGEEEVFLADNDYRETILEKADAIINKPFDVGRVLAKIRELVN